MNRLFLSAVFLSLSLVGCGSKDESSGAGNSRPNLPSPMSIQFGQLPGKFEALTPEKMAALGLKESDFYAPEGSTPTGIDSRIQPGFQHVTRSFREDFTSGTAKSSYFSDRSVVLSSSPNEINLSYTNLSTVTDAGGEALLTGKSKGIPSQDMQDVEWSDSDFTISGLDENTFFAKRKEVARCKRAPGAQQQVVNRKIQFGFYTLPSGAKVHAGLETVRGILDVSCVRASTGEALLEPSVVRETQWLFTMDRPDLDQPLNNSETTLFSSAVYYNSKGMMYRSQYEVLE